jgi:hypothetical protein
MRRIVGYTEVIGLASGCGSPLQGNDKPGERDRKGDGQPETEYVRLAAGIASHYTRSSASPTSAC